mmetsp:Transcript_112173/g.203894  ORF Transcript_112173/g.203894 Transcript_112173/m.203894 type:complete len:93 (-) Transcript_112173:94-372(-)
MRRKRALQDRQPQGTWVSSIWCPFTLTWWRALELVVLKRMAMLRLVVVSAMFRIFGLSDYVDDDGDGDGYAWLEAGIPYIEANSMTWTSCRG